MKCTTKVHVFLFIFRSWNNWNSWTNTITFHYSPSHASSRIMSQTCLEGPLHLKLAKLASKSPVTLKSSFLKKLGAPEEGFAIEINTWTKKIRANQFCVQFVVVNLFPSRHPQWTATRKDWHWVGQQVGNPNQVLSFNSRLRHIVMYTTMLEALVNMIWYVVPLFWMLRANLGRIVYWKKQKSGRAFNHAKQTKMYNIQLQRCVHCWSPQLLLS